MKANPCYYSTSLKKKKKKKVLFLVGLKVVIRLSRPTLSGFI